VYVVFIRWCDGYDGYDDSNYAKRNKLEEEELCGDRLMKNWTCNVKGNTNDVLSISPQQVIQDIYRQYLETGGSNIIGTNTFSSTTIAMADYDMQPYAYEMNSVSARLAREVCDEVTARDPTRPRFVAGAFVGTDQSYGIDWNKSWDGWMVVRIYIDGRKTIFDTLNCESGPVCDDW
jgi:methionine synthase I (cobalamin-dependent)